MEEFEKQKDSAKAQENPYRAVLAWFLEKFPNYDEYKEFFEDKDKTAEAAAAATLAPACSTAWSLLLVPLLG